jgi:hypothetical protein
MVRFLDAATQMAVRDRSRVLPRNFVSIWVGPVHFGFTDFGEDVSASVINGETGIAETRIYAGDNAPIQDIDPIPLKIGIEVDTTQIKLNPLHPVVQVMARADEAALRVAKVQIFRGYLDPDSMLLMAPPRCRRLGQVNGAPETVASVGGQSVRTIKVVSHTRELTRINPAKKSDETYRLRGGDAIGRYAGTAGQWGIFWGENKGSENQATANPGRGGR